MLQWIGLTADLKDISVFIFIILVLVFLLFHFSVCCRCHWRHWRTSGGQTCILDELDNSDYMKMLFNLDKIPKRLKNSRSREKMPQIILKHYGLKASICEIQKVMDLIPRKDMNVQDLLRPFVDKLKKKHQTKNKGEFSLRCESQTDTKVFMRWKIQTGTNRKKSHTLHVMQLHSVSFNHQVH